MKDQGPTLGIQLYVYRRLDNRDRGLPDDSPEAFELHLLRKKALHEALGNVDGWNVDWGEVDDTKSHELAELFVWVVSNPHVVQTAIISGLTWAGTEFAKDAISEFAKQTVTAVLSPLIKKQEEGSILNFYLRLPGGILFHVSRESQVSASHETWPHSRRDGRTLPL